MRKSNIQILISLLFLISISPFIVAQDQITLSFTGRDQYNQHVKLDNVLIDNVTKLWQEVLYYPDTILFIGQTGLQNHSTENPAFHLFQNVPNPFEGETDFSLQLPKESKVHLEIIDINGKSMTSYSGMLTKGVHLFKARLTTPQTYLLHARSDNGILQIKMVNKGHAGQNSIEYLGMSSIIKIQKQPDNAKGITLMPFTLGDIMKYKGFCQINDMEFSSEEIQKAQYASEEISLIFHLPLPVVSTLEVTAITTHSAQLNGNVTSDGGYTVTERGFVVADNADMNNASSYTSGAGTGDFSYTVTDLQPGVCYYYRAYARNSIGTNYGERMIFSTTIVLPEVTTIEVTNITYNEATCSGEVIYDGGAAVTTRGVCWSISENPTIGNSHTINGNGTGSFTSNMTNLTAGTTYHVRAYATNSAGTAYGNQLSFTTAPAVLPTVTTNPVTNITANIAYCGGNVSSDGGAAVTARGVCWSTSPNPTINDSHTNNGSGTGAFPSHLSGLTADTSYYVRAYATNSIGTSYGEQRTFTTLEPSASNPFYCGIDSVTDYDGNIYPTVEIGQQCWMKENLRTTCYADGAAIPSGSGSELSDNTPYRYPPYGNSNNVPTYGYLYNWTAVMHGEPSSIANPSDIQGICPHGWHVPSSTEMTQLINFVSSQSQYGCNGNNTYISKALTATYGWNRPCSNNSCNANFNQLLNNATGFSAVPVGSNGAGLCIAGFGDFGYICKLWTTTGPNYTGGGANHLRIDVSQVTVNHLLTCYALSVRCLLDDTGINGNNVILPAVMTTAINDITSTSAIGTNFVTASGGTAVTARGLCWSATQNPTINDNHTTDGNGTGRFFSVINGLTPGVTYHIRAYATNSVGTSYGEEQSFTTTYSPLDNNVVLIDAQTCPGADTVRDYDNNIYHTVQIGQQCWMKENLRTTHFPNGTAIPLGTTASNSVAYRYLPNGNDNLVPTHGFLYNWTAVMHVDSASNTNPSGVQGICPTGWHVPSATEWEQLRNYVGSQSQYVCGNDSTYIAKALASHAWCVSIDNITPQNSCAIYYDVNSNNATGFSANQVGHFSDGSYDEYNKAYYWSSSLNEEGIPTLILSYYDAHTNIYNLYPNSGCSVRCLRD